MLTTQTTPVSKLASWAGRIVSGVVVLFMLFDATVRVLKTPAAVEETIRLGYPVGAISLVGFGVLVCVVLYLIPRTSTQVRVQDAWFQFPVGLGVLVWLGLYLQDQKL